MRAVDQHNVERLRLPSLERGMRRLGNETDPLGAYALFGAVSKNAVVLVGRGTDRQMRGAAGGEHNGARAGTGLECLHAWGGVTLEPFEGGPAEAEIAVIVSEQRACAKPARHPRTIHGG